VESESVATDAAVLNKVVKSIYKKKPKNPTCKKVSLAFLPEKDPDEGVGTAWTKEH
jgi:hypothetical protein